jgi:hypothetical protein
LIGNKKKLLTLLVEAWALRRKAALQEGREAHPQRRVVGMKAARLEGNQHLEEEHQVGMLEALDEHRSAAPRRRWMLQHQWMG